MIRKNFVAGMNYFDERFRQYWADADLAIKIRKAGRRIEMYPGVRATWHVSAEPASNDAVHKSDQHSGRGAAPEQTLRLFGGI